jgi:hypothetical protein
VTQADRIRQFVLDNYVGPARAEGRAEINIRAGDIHREMGLSNAMPAVCSAIGSLKFGDLAGVSLLETKGPAAGANVYFRFRLGAGPRTMRKSGRAPDWPVRSEQARKSTDLDLRDAVVLVSCVKSKLPHPAPARELYTSAWFRKVRDIIEVSGARWFVLSSLYGLVAPETVIDPYDHTLNTVGVGDRQFWATRVLAKLLPKIAGQHRVVMFAGQRYREFLIEPLQRRGLRVDVPMEHLKRGEQLAWLSEHR